MPINDATPELQEQEQRPSAPHLGAASDYRYKRRLVVCLDGTWNKRDSGTNVYHIANLVLEGKIGAPIEQPDPVVQMVYYDPGVGTGVLDNVTGGAFGVGLSENVREAYDWLVENYRDAEQRGGDDGDEIYVFGFSRGAFTARSLVGLIAKCGLVYRGAPLPPEQLWRGYQMLGSDAAGNEADGAMFHAIKRLKKDPWSSPSDEEMIPEAKWNETERLLVKWSRRVPIHCVGVFDTVGALGADALAIPWVRTRRAQFHDTRLTSLVRNGFHALAIDEHRASFSHVPWTRVVRTRRGVEPPPPTAHVEQRWFIGAHSNIGGGYYDNTLAQLPLAWMLQHCKDLGVKFKPPRPDEPDVLAATQLEDCLPLAADVSVERPAHVCDSYTAFMGGAWRYLVRGKREYRRIRPPLDFENGDQVETIDEDWHDSVPKLMAQDQRYNPPNLWAFSQVRGSSANPTAPKNPDFGRGGLISLAVWLAFVAAGAHLIAGLALTEAHSTAIVVFVILAAAVAAAADLAESAINFNAALAPAHPPPAQRRASILNALIFTRIIGVVLVLLGVVNLLIWIVRQFRFEAPSLELIYMLVLLGLVLQQSMARRWAAHAMTDAGLGAATALQSAKKATVLKCLRAWLRESPKAFVAVRRSLWRDMMGYIPSFTVTSAAGLFLLLEAWAVILRNGARFSLWHYCVVLAIPLVGALADYVEDAIHLSYLRQLERDPPSEPSEAAVKFAFACTVIKAIAFFIGMAAVALAALMLFLLQVAPLVTDGVRLLAFPALRFSDASIPRLINILVGGVLLWAMYSAARQFIRDWQLARQPIAGAQQ